jgi:hypothetical protein
MFQVLEQLPYMWEALDSIHRIGGGTTHLKASMVCAPVVSVLWGLSTRLHRLTKGKEKEKKKKPLTSIILTFPSQVPKF